MIGIIGAMTMEVERIKALMSDRKEIIISNTVFTKGKLSGKDIVVTVSGEGKVNASISAQTMCLTFSPELIINTGIAGGLADGLNIGDIVIASAMVQHDIDVTCRDWAPGYIFGLERVYLDCDKNIIERLSDSVKACGISYKHGIIATGDQFISDSNKKHWIKETFNASACEMEGGAIGHVCVKNDIPFGVIRAISDNSDENAATMSYPEFAELAAINSIKVVEKFVESLR